MFISKKELDHLQRLGGELAEQRWRIDDLRRDLDGAVTLLREQERVIEDLVKVLHLRFVSRVTTTSPCLERLH
jgi:hypothetical protein